MLYKQGIICVAFLYNSFHLSTPIKWGGKILKSAPRFVYNGMFRLSLLGCNCCKLNEKAMVRANRFSG